MPPAHGSDEEFLAEIFRQLNTKVFLNDCFDYDQLAAVTGAEDKKAARARWNKLRKKLTGKDEKTGGDLISLSPVSMLHFFFLFLST